jgi:hypothetical protein
MGKSEKYWWGGFTGGQIAVWNVDDGWGGFTGSSNISMPCVYRTRQEARRRFEDVRKVYITPSLNTKECK